MSFMHCFYSVGVVVSTLILSQVMQGEGGWRNGYRIVFVLQTVIALILFATHKLWKEDVGNEGEKKEVQDIPSRRRSGSRAFS